MLNKVILMGRLTADPELRKTNSELSVANFTIACDRGYSKKDAKKKTDFIDITAWRSTAEFACNWFKKGQLIAVAGKMQVRDWTDKDGNKRKSTVVVAEELFFADSKKSRDGDSGGGSTAKSVEGGNTSPSGFVPDFDDFDDDLPF